MSKVYLENCYLCGESKEAVKYSQSVKDSIYCVLMSYGETPEALQEYDHHVFVVTDKMKEAHERDEAEMYKQMGEFADWVKEEEKRTILYDDPINQGDKYQGKSITDPIQSK